MYIHTQDLTFRKTVRGQLAPKCSDLVTSSSILVAKNIRPFGPYTLQLLQKRGFNNQLYRPKFQLKVLKGFSKCVSLCAIGLDWHKGIHLKNL